MKKTQCVYRITNAKSGRTYIGSTHHFVQRKWRHLYDLKQGRHASRFMQRDYEKCGASAFFVEIVEVVSDQGQLLVREQHWIDLESPCYNSAKVAGSALGIKHRADVVQKNKERNTGFGNGNARLTTQDAEKIKLLLGLSTTERIAQQFGVHRSTILRMSKRVGIKKETRLFGDAARAEFSKNAKKNIAGSNAKPVYLLAEGEKAARVMPSTLAAAEVIQLDNSTLSKLIKKSPVVFVRGYCVSVSPIDAAMVAWPYRGAA